MESEQGLQTLRNLLYKVPLRALLVPVVAPQTPPSENSPPLENSPGSTETTAPNHFHDNNHNNSRAQLPLTTAGHSLRIRNNLNTPSLPELLDTMVTDEVAARTRPHLGPPAGFSAPRLAQIDGSLVNRDNWGELDSISRLPYHRGTNQTAHSGDSGGPGVTGPVPMREPGRAGGQGPADGAGRMDVEPPRVLQNAEVIKRARSRDVVDGRQSTERETMSDSGSTDSLSRLVEAVLVKLEAAPSEEDCDETSSAVSTKNKVVVIPKCGWKI